MKFNDIQVMEAKWEELLQDSVGGQNNGSVYCLLYIDDNWHSLLFPQPPESTDTILSNLGVDLQEYVKMIICYLEEKLRLGIISRGNLVLPSRGSKFQ